MDSSSDEDVDILLRKASDKLGWSSKKNSEQTIQMLRKNVEDSRKKLSCTSRRRRQTPRADNRRAKTATGQPSLTSRRILSYKSSPLDPPQSEPPGDERDDDGLQILGNLKLGCSIDLKNDENEKQVELKNKSGRSRSYKQEIPGRDKYVNSNQIGGRSTHILVDRQSKKLPVGDKSEESHARVGHSSGSVMDGRGDSKDLMTPSWLDYRGRKPEKQTSSSDSEDSVVEVVPDGVVAPAAAAAWGGDDSNEQSSDLQSPLTGHRSPPSLSQRLLENFRDKKKQEQRGRNGLSDGGAKAPAANRGIYARSTLTSSDDDNFETFLQKMKTPQKTKPAPSADMDSGEDFINDGPISEGDDDGPLFYYQQENEGIEEGCLVKTPPSRILTDQTNRSTSSNRFIILSSSSDEDDVFTSPVKPKLTEKTQRVGTKLSHPADVLTPKTPVNKILDDKKRTFLRSLDTPPINAQSDSPYVKNFKKRKEELTAKLFAMYNKSVFDSKLPSDMQVLWNKRMRKTAGYCVYTRAKLKGTRDVRIELSEKVCDTAERLRDTLIHEMCHAACWLINGVNDGHGRFWKYWATKANLAHPDLPPIRRCHSYEITTKYKYQCQQCKSTVGRHSKSLDVTKKCCGICKGRFVLLPTGGGKENNKKQQPNKFAMFVKENYATIKKSNNSFKHADVMRMLSQEFARKATLDN